MVCQSQLVVMDNVAGIYKQSSWMQGKQSYQHRPYRRITYPQGVYWKLPNNGKQGYHYRIA